VNHTDVITKSLPDCCVSAVADLTHPALAQSVVCEKTHRVTWIGEEEGWHSTAQQRREHVPRSQHVPQGPYSSYDVTKITGCSYRNLDFWCSQGWIEGQTPQGSGTRRRFTEKQIWRVKELRQASKIKSLSVAAIAFRLRPLFELERKARGIKDVPVQGNLL
jgi:MerR HTH family regulatory protein